MFGIKKLKSEIVELRQEMQDLRDLADDNHNEQWDLLRQVHNGVNTNISALADRLNVHIRTRVICTTCEGCGCLVDSERAHTKFSMEQNDVVMTHYCKSCAGEMQKKTSKEKSK